MAPANPLPLEQPAGSLDPRSEVPSSDVPRTDGPHADGPHADGPHADTLGSSAAAAAPQPVSQEELNAWRRGFTPQAEIWNGRLAMLGLSVGLTVLLLARLFATTRAS